MIELFSSDTPNGKKVSIMLEEVGFDYKVTKLDLAKGDQLKPEFKLISPFSKIPTIVDHSNNKEAVFETEGASYLVINFKNQIVERAR